MLQRVLFRADSGPDIGDGHVMRCLALAQEFARKGAEPLLLTRALTGRACLAWKASGFEISLLDSNHDLRDDAAVTASVARAWQVRCIVLDGYGFQRVMFQELHDAGFVTARFDDTGEADFPGSLVINQNPGAEMRFPHAYSEARKALLGHRYACLREEILSLISIGGDGVLICFGGSEPASTGFAITRAIHERDEDVPIVLVGPNATAYGSVSKNLNVHEPTDLVPLFKSADVVVCGAGVTALEVLYLRIPAVILPIATNQLPGAEALRQTEVVKVVSSTADAASTAIDLYASVKGPITSAAPGKGMLDGKGTERIHREIMQMVV